MKTIVMTPKQDPRVLPEWDLKTLLRTVLLRIKEKTTLSTVKYEFILAHFRMKCYKKNAIKNFILT